MYEVTLFDETNGRMHTGRGPTVPKALETASRKAFGLERPKRYRVTTTDDETLGGLKEIPEHTNYLLVIAGLRAWPPDRPAIAEGFVQPLER